MRLGPPEWDWSLIQPGCSRRRAHKRHTVTGQSRATRGSGPQGNGALQAHGLVSHLENKEKPRVSFSLRPKLED